VDSNKMARFFVGACAAIFAVAAAAPARAQQYAPPAQGDEAYAYDDQGYDDEADVQADVAEIAPADGYYAVDAPCAYSPGFVVVGVPFFRGGHWYSFRRFNHPFYGSRSYGWRGGSGYHRAYARPYGGGGRYTYRSYGTDSYRGGRDGYRSYGTGSYRGGRDGYRSYVSRPSDSRSYGQGGSDRGSRSYGGGGSSRSWGGHDGRHHSH
jgi:hypothetical protein